MILVLDDNRDDLEILSHYFKKQGITDFKIFTDYKAFLKAINEEVIIVIIDHHLGSIKTGLGVMKEVVDLNPICYPIIVSGNNNPKIILEYLNSDAFRYVLKNDKDYLDTVITFIRQAKERIDKVTQYLKNG